MIGDSVYRLQLFLALAFLVLLSSCASKGVPISPYDTPAKALLIMDMQSDFVGPQAKMPISEPSKVPLIETINKLSLRARDQGILVIYIRNMFSRDDIANSFRNRAAIKGNPGSEIDPRVNIVSENLFDKDQPDAFSNPELEKFLVSHKVNTLIITGVFADQCCYYTSWAALNRNYHVTYIKDAVGSSSDSNIENAAKSLREKGASVILSSDL